MCGSARQLHRLRLQSCEWPEQERSEVEHIHRRLASQRQWPKSGVRRDADGAKERHTRRLQQGEEHEWSQLELSVGRVVCSGTATCGGMSETTVRLETDAAGRASHGRRRCRSPMNRTSACAGEWSRLVSTRVASAAVAQRGRRGSSVAALPLLPPCHSPRALPRCKREEDAQTAPRMLSSAQDDGSGEGRREGGFPMRL